MRNTLFTALNKAERFVTTTIFQINGITRPCAKFFSWLFQRWLMLLVRRNVLNLSRYGGYSEKTLHRQLQRKLPFLAFFHRLFTPLRKRECIAAFDPCFIRKSGPKTYGVGRFWNGTQSKAARGLEIGCLALLDVKDHAAYALQAEQTPGKVANLISHYAAVVTRHLSDLTPYTRHLAADGYFWKKSFVRPLLAGGLEVISKGRQDCKLLYRHQGAQPLGRGRHRRYDGRVLWQDLDRTRWKRCYEDEQAVGWELVVWCPMLGREVKAVYVAEKKTKAYTVLLCTDKELAGEKVISYYHLRFQIEFLLRDAKSHCGLEQCQSRSAVKLHNHFNMALYSVSVARRLLWAKDGQAAKPPFSLRSIKTYCINRFMARTIFDHLGLDLNEPKIKSLFEQCLHIGEMAA